jgi:hypothetical protein
MNGSRRHLVRAVLFAVLASVTLGTATVGAPASAAVGKAGVVVVHGDGKVKVDCVRLTKAEISGFRLLQKSRFDFLAAEFSFGHAVCWLDGEGVETTNTSDCLPASGPTWGYFTQNKGDTGPVSSEVGPDDRTVTRGSVDYWVFGEFPQATPAPRTVRNICS